MAPGPATEQNESGTGVLSPSPSLRQYLKGSTRDSWNNSWDRYDYRDKWTDVWKSDHGGNRWIHGWNEHYHDDNWTDFGESVTLVTSGVRATGKRAAGVRPIGRRADGTRQARAVIIAKDSSAPIILSSRQRTWTS